MDDDRRILERIDLCRPRSDDAALAELSPLAEELAADPSVRMLYERVQALDSKIARAFRDVPVPAVLAERLLAALAETASQTDVSTSSVVGAAERTSPSPTVAVPSSAEPRSSFTRRWWISAAALAIAAALLLMVFRPRNEPLTPDDVLASAMEFHDAQPLHVAQPFGDPLPRLCQSYPPAQAIDLRRSVDTRWWEIEKPRFLGRRGVAYELRSARGARATLYVVGISTSALGAPAITPASFGGAPAQPQTGNRPIATWREGNLLYVMVVDGTAKDYREFLRQPPELAALPSPPRHVRKSAKISLI